MNKFILSGCCFVLFSSSTSMAADIDFKLSPPPVQNPGTNITVAPTMIPGSTIPRTPSPPHNPSQVSPPSPGVSITIPIDNNLKPSSGKP